jgi:hypothetical protein
MRNLSLLVAKFCRDVEWLQTLYPEAGYRCQALEADKVIHKVQVGDIFSSCWFKNELFVCAALCESDTICSIGWSRSTNIKICSTISSKLNNTNWNLKLFCEAVSRKTETSSWEWKTGHVCNGWLDTLVNSRTLHNMNVPSEICHFLSL